MWPANAEFIKFITEYYVSTDYFFFEFSFATASAPACATL